MAGSITSLGTRTALLPEPEDLFEDEDIPFLPLSSTASVSIASNIEHRELQHFTFLCSPSVLVSGLQQKQTQEVHGERNVIDKLIPLVQSKLIEHGFSVLDENTVFQAEADLKPSSDNISPNPSVLQSLLEESIKRVIEVLEQYGRRGQLVQELILRAETAARQNERLTVDNKELALQITDLTKHERGPSSVENGAVCAHATWGSEQIRKEVMEVQKELADTREDLAVSLRREAGLSSELHRVEQERAAERKRLETSLGSLRRKVCVCVCVCVCVYAFLHACLSQGAERTRPSESQGREARAVPRPTAHVDRGRGAPPQRGPHSPADFPAARESDGVSFAAASPHWRCACVRLARCCCRGLAARPDSVSGIYI